MKEKIIFILIIILMIPFHIITNAQIVVSKPRLSLTENKLTIEYDILNSQPTDTFNVWIGVTDANGNIIKVSSLTGDFGEKIKGGLNRKIIWDLKQDNIIIEEGIFVEVMAEKNKIPEVQKESLPITELSSVSKTENTKDSSLAETTMVSKTEISKESTYDESNSSSREKRVSKGNIVLSSIVLPGWGQSKIHQKKPYWIMGVTAYGCLAGSIILNHIGASTYDDYLASTDIEDCNTLFKKSVRQDNISEYLAYSAVGIWTINMIWALASHGSSRELTIFQRDNPFKIKPGYDPYSKSTILILSYRF
jgi:hypothetical protein